MSANTKQPQVTTLLAVSRLGKGVDRSVSANELRKAGILIPENIPGCAWVPASSIHLDMKIVETSAESEAQHVLRYDAVLTFSKPFQYVQARVPVKPTL